jgi:pimeloyl-ACP methyl ester carboxylesterase
VDLDLSLPSGRIRARRWGPDEAPLLLCVHGVSANLAAFTYLAEHLAGDPRQVVAIDLRGCGRSEVTPPGSYGLEDRATDVLDVADALGADEFDFAGWSLGALIGMHVALRAAARLRSVALIEHAGPAQSAALVAVREWMGRLDVVTATPGDYLSKMRRAGLIEPWSPFWDAFYSYDLEQRSDGAWSPLTSRAAAFEEFDQPWPRDWSEHWRALTMPTVLVRAIQPLNGALIVPGRAVTALHAANPSVRVVEAPDSTHFTCMVDPVTVEAVRGVLGAS